VKLPASPPDPLVLLQDLQVLERIFKDPPGPEVRGHYLHWDEVRRRSAPAGWTHEQWWAGIELARRQMRRRLPLLDAHGSAFEFATPDEVQRLLHEVDRDLGGRIELPEHINSPEVRDRYVISSLIEEAITSSQLEGASTTRQVAKEMIRSGRPPRTDGEKMILNNYRAMEFIGTKVGSPLTRDVVLELHEVLTRDILDPLTGAGRFRRDEEAIHVVDEDDGTTLHVPPPASSLAHRMAAMCRFANGETPDFFVHPVIRAILIHFWLAHDHPFVDGNGRTARALFYWSLQASQDYWLVRFLSISRILKKAPAQYSRAFLYSETTGNDVTYFLIHQLHVIRKAVDELIVYIKRKLAEVRDVESRLKLDGELNHRQLAVLGHAIRHPGFLYTIDSHQHSHNVVYQTARTDLLDLAKRRLLKQRKVGRRFVFEAPAGLDERYRRQR
jgi:Fic family protein